jgi:hypothetical protein
MAQVSSGAETTRELLVRCIEDKPDQQLARTDRVAIVRGPATLEHEFLHVVRGLGLREREHNRQPVALHSAAHVYRHTTVGRLQGALKLELSCRIHLDGSVDSGRGLAGHADHHALGGGHKAHPASTPGTLESRRRRRSGTPSNPETKNHSSRLHLPLAIELLPDGAEEPKQL